MNNKLNSLILTDIENKEKGDFVKNNFINFIKLFEKLNEEKNIISTIPKELPERELLSVIGNLPDIQNYIKSFYIDCLHFQIKDELEVYLNFDNEKKIRDKKIIKKGEKIDFTQIDFFYNGDIFLGKNKIIEVLVGIIKKNDFSYIYNEVEKIDFSSKASFLNYLINIKNTYNKDLSKIQRDIYKLRENLNLEYFQKGIFKGEKLENGKLYIKYEKGDLEKIDKDERYIDLVNKKTELIKNETNFYWLKVDNYTEEIYVVFEKIFLEKIYKQRENDSSSFLIPLKDFYYSRIEFDNLLNKIEQISFNKNYTKKIDELGKKDFLLFLINEINLNNIKIRDLIFEKKDLAKIEEYINIRQKIKDDLIKNGIIGNNYRSSTIHWEIKKVFLAQTDLKKVFNSYERLNKKEEEIKDVLYNKCKQLIQLYNEYKEGYYINADKNIKFRSEFGYNNIILYNNSIDKLDFKNYISYSFRCYDFKEFIFGEIQEAYCQGRFIAENIEDLINKIENQFGIKVFEGSWKEEYKQKGYKKLWIKEKENIENFDKSKLKLSICENCGKIYKIKEGYIGNCQEYCYRKKKEELNKKEEEYIDKNKEESINKSMDIFDDVIENNEDSIKDEIGNYITEAVIYRIFNKITGFSYIGKTEQHFTTRWSQHFSNLNTSSPFKDDLNNYGLSSFSFEILEEINKKDIDTNSNSLSSEDFCRYILIREQYYIDFFNSYKNGYNRRNNFSKKNKININNITLDFK